MSENIRFVRNYTDLSTDAGFQFEFFCDRCGTGYRTEFKASASSGLGKALHAAGGLFGGIFSSAASLGDTVRDAAWEKGHDNAFREAVADIAPSFIQCPRCRNWVCNDHCWNEKRGICKECAPDLGVEMSAAQASRSVEEVWAHAKMSAEDKKLSESNWRETIRASCPQCQVPLAVNAKFCPECGASLKMEKRCPACQTTISSLSKFCPECGSKC